MKTTGLWGGVLILVLSARARCMTWHVIRVRSKDTQKQLTRTSLRTFAPIVSAHLYCARESHATSCHVMPRHASSARAKY